MNRVDSSYIGLTSFDFVSRSPRTLAESRAERVRATIYGNDREGATMGLFSKKTPATPDDARQRVTALVITADAPPQGAPRSGSYSRGSIRVLVDTPAGPHRQLVSTFPFADDHWLAAGMEIPVLLDPGQPDAFEVDWANVPTMQEQVAANAPALADPFAASRRIAQAAGITPSEKTAAQYERFQKAVDEASTKPAPAGSERAVAMVATVRGRYSSGDTGDDGGSTGSEVSLMRESAAVLSVAIPGEARYAVYVPKFKVPRSHIVIPGEPINVLVKTTNRQDVEILWSELPQIGDQIAARASDSAAANSKLMSAMSEQIEAATAAAAASPDGPNMAGTGMPPAMREMLVGNLKRSLMYVNDPARRQQMIDQYKTMGLEISPDELA